MSNENMNNELQRMKELMGYGLNEGSKKNGQSIVEYHQVGADGQTYGIIKENNKFYIKVAPKKDTEVLAEDYDYIGGFMNKKQHEYSTYTIAAKQFGLKMKSLNEANTKTAVSIDLFKPTEDAEWQINETREMRNEINRFKQITNNVAYILSENKEGEGRALELGSPEKGMEDGNPFVENPVSTDKINNMKENESDPKKADSTYNEKAEYEEEFKGNEHNNPKTADNTFSKNANKVESDGVAVAAAKGDSHKNDKGVKMNEGKTIKLTEEQVLAWNKSLDYMDTSKGTEVGDTAPFTDKLSNEESNQDMNEGAIHNTEDMNQHVSDTGDTAPFDEKVPNEQSNQKMNEETDIDPDTGLPVSDTNSTMITDNEKEFDAEPINMNEDKLDVYGKHPAYQKVPMTTPDNKEIDKWGRDWNDISAKGDKPFGTKIGHGGDPFSEKVIDMLTDAVMSKLKKKVN